MIPFSAETKQGVEEIWEVIESFLPEEQTQEPQPLRKETAQTHRKPSRKKETS